MQTRRIERADLPALAKILKRAYPRESWTTEAASTYLQKFFEFEPRSCYAVVEDDGRVTAAVLAYSYYRADRLVLFLQDLFVDPDFRHRGYATALVESVRGAFLQSATVNVVPLVKADTAVLNFYNNLGFERAEVFAFIDDDY